MIRWDWLVLAYASLFVYGLADNARGPVFPDILKEFSLSDSLGSMFFFISSGAAFVNNLFAYRWIERIGPYRTIQVYSLLQGIALLIFAFSKSYGLVLIGSALLGVSTGGLAIGQNVLTAWAVTGPKGRQAMSGLHTMYGVASLLAPLMVTGLYRFGWEWGSVLAWIALGSGAVLFYSIGPWSSARGEVVATLVERSSSGRSEASSRGARPWRAAIVFALIFGLYVVAEVGLSSRLVLVVRRDDGFSPAMANLLLSVFFIALFLGRLLFALVEFPWRNSSVLAWSAAVSAVSFGLGLAGQPLWFPITGLAMSMFYPCAMNMIAEEMGEEAGFVITWSVTAQDLGLVLMHFALGALSDLVGLRSALWIGPTCLILVLFFLWLGVGGGRRDRKMPL